MSIKEKYVINPVDLPHVPQSCWYHGAEFEKNEILREIKNEIEITQKSLMALELNWVLKHSQPNKIAAPVDNISIFGRLIGS